MAQIEVNCDVYKSTRKEHLFLYVDHDVGLERVPEDLLQQFGEPEMTISFLLTRERTLAREDPVRVLANLNEHGYHLQLPPAASLIAPGNPVEKNPGKTSGE